MAEFLRMVKADFMKMRNTAFYWMHACVPVAAVMMFLGYYSFSRQNAVGKALGYAQIISIAFPIIIGIVCSMVVDQEAAAGGFKEMLGAAFGKSKSLLSKIILLLVCGYASTIIASTGFFLGFQYILHQNVLPTAFYFNMILVIFGSQVFIYLFHILLSFLSGSGASIGVGIFESLFSALLLTGLGDGRWQWIPCGWAVRFCDYLLIRYNSLSRVYINPDELNLGIRNCIFSTVLLGIFLMIWFNFYEGRKEKQ